MRSCWMPKIVTPRVSSAPGPHSKHRNGRPFPYVIKRARTVQSAWQLAAEFGISDVSACAAVNRKTWAHVT